jgi:hypothetical protein
MSDPGLTRRLRQQSHRSGLAIGLSMALAIAVLFGGFTWIYVQLDPWVRDFAGAEVAPPTPTPRDQAADEQSDEEPPADEGEDEPAPTEAPDDQPNDDQSGDTDSGNIDPVSEDDSAGFDADYQVATLEQVNMRSGPGRSFDIVTPLEPGTPLESTGNRQPAPDPEDGGLEWLEFETENGNTGWIRSIDVGET